MSSIFSDLAATSLVRSLSAAPASGRHLVTSVADGDVPGLFRAVLSRAQRTRGFAVSDAETAELWVIELDEGAVIVPYLVIEPPPASPRENRGGQGFIGAIRDRFEDAAGEGERILLLTFDERPNETELTTMDQAVAGEALELERVFALALEPPEGAGHALRRVLAELPPVVKRLRDRLTPETIGQTALGAATLATASSNAEVAEELYAVPWCLKDPPLFEYAGPDLRRRLADATRLRAEIGAWASDPTTDFDTVVRGRFPEAVADRVQGARQGQAIDWSRFSFDDLKSGDPPPKEGPLAFASLPIEIAEATTLKLLSHGTVAAHIPGPGVTLKFQLTGPLTGKSTIHVNGFTGDRPPYVRDGLAALTAADGSGAVVSCALKEVPQPREGWSFIEVVLTRGPRLTKTRLGEITLALRIDPEDSTLIYETGGRVDLESQAYSGAEDLTFVGEREGAEIFAEKIQPPDEIGALTVAGEWDVPAIQVETPEDDSEDVTPTESPLHLSVEAWAAGQTRTGEFSPRVRQRPDGTVVADIGVLQTPIEAGEAMPLPRWLLERYVIEHPEYTTFELATGGEIRPADAIEKLELGSLEAPFGRFRAARRAFFEELAGRGVKTVLSAMLRESATAAEYVESYGALLEAVPDGEAGELGYDRILLADAIFVAESGEVMFAPTSPLTVAAHAQLEELVPDWIQNEPAANYFPGDVASLSPRYLVPFLRLQNGPAEWLESGYAPYPWRRYLPVSKRSELQRPPSLRRYIARRIERFLDVHPNYRDERRTLRLAFINPGSGTHVRDALLLLVDPVVRGKKGVQLPSLELQLLSDAPAHEVELLGADLDLFMGLTPEDGQPSDAAMEVMKRLSYTKGAADEFLTDPKSFAHLTFVENFFRPQPDLVEWERQAHPTSYYVGGLAADTERLARTEASATRFLTSTWTGSGGGSHPLASLATRTTEIAAAAAGVPVKRGITRAADVRVPDSVIPQLYDRSVWVVHVDRHIGLELFYPQNIGSGAPYILDYTDQETPDPGVFDGITATKQVEPYHARIGAILGAITGEPLAAAAAERLLRTLNLISGRWGIEMLRTDDNTLRARLATVIAAQALEEAERHHDDPSSVTMVIALDELLRATGGEGLPLRSGWLAKSGRTGGGSDDLFILTVPLGEGRPRLRGRVVEVKYRSAVGTSPDEAAAQIAKTYHLLREVLCAEDEPGRSFQGRHLAKLILRYTGRHHSYGVGGTRPAISSATAALTRVALGDYDLDIEIEAPDGSLLGDFVSVEPNLHDGTIERLIHVSREGARVGRLRIGLPVMKRLLGGPRNHTATGERAWSGAADDEAVSGRGVGEGHMPVSAGTEVQAPGLSYVDGEPPKPGGTTEAEPTPVGANHAKSESVSPRATQRSDQDEGSSAAADDEAERGQRPATDAEAGDQALPAVAVSPFSLEPAVLRSQAARLDDVLSSFKLPLQPVEAANAVCGPNVIRFRVLMARGGTIAQLEARERDIMRELGKDRPVMIDQDAGFVTLDVPRQDAVTVQFRDLAPVLAEHDTRRGELPVLFGVDVSGKPRIENLAALPHLLVAGTTGAGKSVFLSALLASLARLPPSHVEIVLVDVKGLDFAPFKSLPHLRQPPIGEPEAALDALEGLYEAERARRRQVLAEAGAQSILDYYDRVGGTDLKQIVVVIDEFSNLLTGDKATGSQLEDVVQKYAEIMRSFGVYLVIATQRPSADIVTGRIKANLPARCAFRLPTHVDSMTILGRKGAEQLLGKGDMLFYRDGAVERLQAPLTNPGDVLDVAARG